MSVHRSVPSAELKRLGKVLHLSKSGNLIVQLEPAKDPRDIYLPNIGREVYNAKLDLIGTVNNLLGPVTAPYASLTPSKADSGSFSGKMVYVREMRQGDH